MFSKLKTLTVLAAASATISVSAVAAPYIDVRVAPPPPRHEVVPAARAGYTWAPGYWDWRGHRHVWVSGHWERERHGYVYHEPRWEQTATAGACTMARWDRDHDGVPNVVDAIPTTRVDRSGPARAQKPEPRLFDESGFLGRRPAAEDFVAMGKPAESLDHGAMTMRIVEHVRVLRRFARRAV